MNVENIAEYPINQTGDESHVLYDLLKSVYIFSNCCRSPTVALGGGAFLSEGCVLVGDQHSLRSSNHTASLRSGGAPSSNHEATGQRLIIERSTVNNRKVNG